MDISELLWIIYLSDVHRKREKDASTATNVRLESII